MSEQIISVIVNGVIACIAIVCLTLIILQHGKTRRVIREKHTDAEIAQILAASKSDLSYSTDSIHAERKGGKTELTYKEQRHNIAGKIIETIFVAAGSVTKKFPKKK